MSNKKSTGRSRGLRRASAFGGLLISVSTAACGAPPRHNKRPLASGHTTQVAGKAAAPNAVKPFQWQPLYEPGSGGAITDVSVSPFDSRRVLVAGDMLGVGVSTDRGDVWQATFGFKAWEMASFTWHPGDPMTVWVGSMSGPYVSHDGGVHWAEKRQGLPPSVGFGYPAPVEKVLFDPADATHQHLLAIGGSSRHWPSNRDDSAWGVVWETRDGGENWTRLTTITEAGTSSDAPSAKGVNITWAAYAPSGAGQAAGKLLYATTDAAFVASEDGGRTWHKRMNGLPPAGMGRVALHPTDPNTLWMTVGSYVAAGAKQLTPSSVFKTMDGGQSWTDSSCGLPKYVSGTDYNLTASYRALAVAPSRPNVLYVNDQSYTTGTTFRSDDGGASWRMVASKQNIGSDNNDPQKRAVFQLQTACPAGMGLNNLIFDPKDAEAAYGFNTEFMPRTLDGGKTWNDATSVQPAGAAPGAWRGRGFSGWVTINFRFNPYKRNQSVFQGMDATRAWVSNDGLHSWTRVFDEPDAWNGGRDVCFTRNGTLYATTGTYNFTGVGRSTDGGKTWTVLHGAPHGLPDFYKGAAPGGIYALPDEPKRVWAVVDGKLLNSEDGGEHWMPVLERAGLQWMAADPNKPYRFYVAGERNIYVTEDGRVFTPIGGPHARDTWLAVDGKGRLLASAFGGARNGLWRYDAALPLPERWTRLSDEDRIGGCAADPTNPDRIAFSTNQNSYTDVSLATGVWVSGDDGKTWAQQNDGLAMTRGLVITFDPFEPSRLIFGSYGRGYWTCRWPTSYTPHGTRTYTSTPDDAHFAAIQDESRFAIRDFGAANFDYVYGQDWKLGQNVTTGEENGVGYVKIDSTEFGGAGIVLNGVNIAPSGQKFLTLRARLLPGNEAGTLSVNVIPKTGTNKSFSFDLTKLNAQTWTTLTLPLGAGDFSAIQQVQIQGASFGAGAKPLKIELDSLNTTGP